MKKFNLTGETKVNSLGIKLHRIVALKPFGDVEEGQFGGWVESEKNLSQFDNSWIYDDAEVIGTSRVYNDAKIYGRARIMNDSRIGGRAIVYDAVISNSWVYGFVRIGSNAEIYNAEIHVG